MLIGDVDLNPMPGHWMDMSVDERASWKRRERAIQALIDERDDAVASKQGLQVIYESERVRCEQLETERNLLLRAAADKEGK